MLCSKVFTLERPAEMSASASYLISAAGDTAAGDTAAGDTAAGDTAADTLPVAATRWKKRFAAVAALLSLLLFAAGCRFSELLVPATPTPAPTRTLSPTFTPTPEALLPLVVVTPPRDGTPGVIVIQPTIDADRVVIAIPPSSTPTPVLWNRRRPPSRWLRSSQKLPCSLVQPLTCCCRR